MKSNILTLATKKTTERIRHEFSDKELSDMKTDVSTNMITTYSLKDELQEIKDSFKAKIDPLEKKTKKLLKNINDRFEDIDMQVLNVPDDERLVIEFYDEEGTKVGERKMTPDEKPSIQFNKQLS